MLIPAGGQHARQRGFTLLELVLGLVILAISSTVLVSVLLPLQQQAANYSHQVRSIELAQALLAEIQARAFDDATPSNGSLLRCDEQGAASCVAAFPACPTQGSSAITEESQRADFDDVDDYHCFRASGAALVDVLGQPLADSYRNYQLAVQVSYAGTEYGLAQRRIKKISVTVTSPDGERWLFTRLKGNW